MGAPLNPVPNVLRVFLEGLVDNNDVYKWGNVIHFQYAGGPPSNTDCITLASGFTSQWATHMSPEQPSPAQLTSCTVTDLTSDSSGAGTFLSSTPGTRGDDSIPANAAVLMHWAATSRYRGGHPRTYLLAGGNADLDGAALWSTLFTAEIQTHWRAFLTACLGESAGTTTLTTFGAVRYRGRYAPNGGPPHYYLNTPVWMPQAVADIFAVQEMASQRRRIGRRKA